MEEQYIEHDGDAVKKALHERRLVPEFVGTASAVRHTSMPAVIPRVEEADRQVLTSQGHLVGDGTLYGVDYVLYPGDPGVFHGTHLVERVPGDNAISMSCLLGLQRVSASVHKSLILLITPPSSSPSDTGSPPTALLVRRWKT
jgi:hypothetical protein